MGRKISSERFEERDKKIASLTTTTWNIVMKPQALSSKESAMYVRELKYALDRVEEEQENSRYHKMMDECFKNASLWSWNSGEKS